MGPADSMVLIQRKPARAKKERLRARLAERHIVLELTEGAREYLAAAGYDPQYGARPLKRAIQKELETPLGKLLLKGEVSDGHK